MGIFFFFLTLKDEDSGWNANSGVSGQKSRSCKVRMCMNEFKYVSDETKQDLSCRKQTPKSPFYLVQKRKRLFSRGLASCATIVLTYHSPVKAVKTLYSE